MVVLNLLAIKLIIIIISFMRVIMIIINIEISNVTNTYLNIINKILYICR